MAVLGTLTITMAGGPGPVAARNVRQDPAFRSSTDLVRVYATVRDATGHLLTDLERGDFVVRDRGTQVPLAVFSKAAQPIRLSVLLDLALGVYEPLTFEQLRLGLSALVDQFEPGDRGTIGWFSRDRIEVGPALTSDTAALKARIESEIQIQHLDPRFADLKPNEGIFGFRGVGRPLWNAIGAAAGRMASEEGRKVILVLANGDNTTVIDGYPRLKELRQMIASDEVMVYAIHGFEPRLSTPREDDIRGSSDERTTTLEEMTALTGGGFLVAPFDPRKHTLGMGGVNAGRNPLSLAFRSQLAGVMEELRHQYTLGFVPSKRDGKVGSIDVRVTRPRTRVWARKTYLAPRP